MQSNIKQKQKVSSIFILSTILSGLILGNILFLLFSQNQGKTINLLRNELVSLEQNQKIIASAKEISDKYDKEIIMISEVFPSEETVAVFIQQMESEIRIYADEYNFKFNAVEPVKEQDKLFLPTTLTLRTDLPRLLAFFEKIEKMPYMTHVTNISTKLPDGFNNKGETIINLKLYDQNPFNAQ